MSSLISSLVQYYSEPEVSQYYGGAVESGDVSTRLMDDLGVESHRNRVYFGCLVGELLDFHTGEVLQ